MLPRRLEPEVMASPEEARDYDTMDHSAVNRVFVDDFLAVWDGAGPVLDVGTGTGQIPVALGQRCENVEMIAIDFSEEMLKLAAINVARAGLGSRIRLQHGDAQRMPHADGAFGAAISNSIVHHIPEPRSVLREIMRVVRPGGCLFVRDLLRPGNDAEVCRLVRTYAGSANKHQQQMFEDSLRAALTVAEIQDLVGELGFRRDSVRQTTDRHWTWSVRNLNG